MRKKILVVGILSALLLSGCGESNNADVTEDTTTAETELDTSVTTGVNISEESSEADVTEDVKTAETELVTNENGSLNISADFSEEDFIREGSAIAEFYSYAEKRYFFFNSDYGWKIDYDAPGDEIVKGGFGLTSYRCYGLYTDVANDIYTPMTYAEAKTFLMETLMLTGNGFNEMCDNSPCGYYEQNGEFYMQPYDGGSAGFDYSVIDSCEMSGDTVTYNCRCVGLAEEWAYDEDMVYEFTFRLKLEDGVWKLDGCSNGQGLVYFTDT